MNGLRNFLLVGLAFIVVALGVLVSRQHVMLRTLRAEQAALMSEPLARAETLLDESAGAPPRGRPDGAPAHLAVTVDAAVPGDSKRETERLAGLAELMENPQFLRALVSHQRTMLDNRFAPLFRQLDLTPAELDILRELLIEKQNSALDVMMVTGRGAVPGAGAGEVRRATQQAQGEIDAMIRSTLGDERFAQFKAFEATLPQRATVAQLTQRLSYTDTPLQPAQADALVTALTRAGGQGESLPGVSVVLSAEDRRAVPIVQSTAEASRITDEVVALADEVLAPRQVAALRQLQAEQSAAATMVRLARAAMPAGGSGSAANSLLDGLDVHLLLQ